MRANSVHRYELHLHHKHTNESNVIQTHRNIFSYLSIIERSLEPLVLRMHRIGNRTYCLAFGLEELLTPLSKSVFEKNHHFSKSRFCNAFGGNITGTDDEQVSDDGYGLPCRVKSAETPVCQVGTREGGEQVRTTAANKTGL